jgi:hypothetical protein
MNFNAVQRSRGVEEFGTFDLDLSHVARPTPWPSRRESEADLARFFRSFTNASIARDLFQILEDARIDAAICERS